jgi:enoyl-CoA hydratase
VLAARTTSSRSHLNAADGLLPLGGIAQALARLPASIGLYVALTGYSLNRADAFALGLLTHTIPANAHPAIVAGLADNQPVDPLLDQLHVDPGPSQLMTRANLIGRCFAAASPGAVMDKLAEVAPPDAAWARATRADIEKQPALARAAIHRLLTEASRLDVRGGLILSHRVAANWQSHDTTLATDLDLLFFSNKNASLTLPERSEVANGRF